MIRFIRTKQFLDLLLKLIFISLNFLIIFDHLRFGAMLRTIEKACRALLLFTEEKPEWGVTEVARTLQIPKSSAAGILATLAHHGLLRRTPSRKYRLGWEILRLHTLLVKTSEFRQLAHHEMERLAREYGETIHLATLENGMVVYVDKVEGSRSVRVHVTGLGVRLPPHGSAVGKVLLAYHPWKEVLQIIQRHGLPALTPNTIVTLERLEQELIRVRQQGYAIDEEEVLPELCCVAAPIRNYLRQTIAAMSISAPSYRFRLMRERYTQAVVAACQRISRKLGFACG